MPVKPGTKRKPKPNLATIKALTDAGHTIEAIAQTTGYHRDTISKYLQSIRDSESVRQVFRQSLGDAMTTDLLLGMELKHKLLISLSEESPSNLSSAEKRQLLRDVTVSNGIVFDKLRLHEGKSTANHAHQIQLNQVHSGMAQQPRGLRSEARLDQDGHSSDGSLFGMTEPAGGGGDEV